MAKYKGQVKVTTESFDAWKKATFGNAYDVDVKYNYQCYDYINIFWINACGRRVKNKTADGGVAGGASGIWGARIENNKNNEFDLITNYNDLKRGDIVITNNGTYGHGCFLDEDNNGQTYLRILGQNQNNSNGLLPGAEVSIINWKFKSVFLGAFRFKKWKNSDIPTSKYPYNTVIPKGTQLYSASGSKYNKTQANRNATVQGELNDMLKVFISTCNPNVVYIKNNNSTSTKYPFKATIKKGSKLYKENGAAYPNGASVDRVVTVQGELNGRYKVYGSTFNPNVVYVNKNSIK